MKKITLLTWLLLVSFLSHANLESKPLAHVQIVSKRMDVFYFKVDREFLGADLEIYSADGKNFSPKVQHRKVLIDFYFEDAGNFIIYVKKGDVFEEFEFKKEKACPEADRPTEWITVTQGV